eukprot:6027287-Amphidinium_carterae.1
MNQHETTFVHCFVFVAKWGVGSEPESKTNCLKTLKMEQGLGRTQQRRAPHKSPISDDVQIVSWQPKEPKESLRRFSSPLSSASSLLCIMLLLI